MMSLPLDVLKQACPFAQATVGAHDAQLSLIPGANMAPSRGGPLSHPISRLAPQLLTESSYGDGLNGKIAAETESCLVSQKGRQCVCTN